MRLARWKAALESVVFLASVLPVPAWSATTDKHSAVPGTLNYVEGQAAIGEQKLDSRAVGSVELQAGQSLETHKGKVEILLTPGVFLRVGDDSSVKMMSPNLTETQLALNRGEAMLEVNQIYPENDIRIRQLGANTRVLKTGLYAFDANSKDIRVFEGKASVRTSDREVTVKGGHELALGAVGKLKPRSFDKKEVAQGDDLYRWSSLRSQYLSQENMETARMYVVDGWYGPGWFGPGWYWNPWFGGFTFLPADGVFYDPFGWGFFSPLVIYLMPITAGHVAHHFDGSRPAAIGRGFHEHAVRTFSAPPVSGFHGTLPPALHRP